MAAPCSGKEGAARALDWAARPGLQAHQRAHRRPLGSEAPMFTLGFSDLCVDRVRPSLPVEVHRPHPCPCAGLGGRGREEGGRRRKRGSGKGGGEEDR